MLLLMALGCVLSPEPDPLEEMLAGIDLPLTARALPAPEVGPSVRVFVREDRIVMDGSQLDPEERTTQEVPLSGFVPVRGYSRSHLIEGVYDTLLSWLDRPGRRVDLFIDDDAPTELIRSLLHTCSWAAMDDRRLRLVDPDGAPVELRLDPAIPATSPFYPWPSVSIARGGWSLAIAKGPGHGTGLPPSIPCLQEDCAYEDHPSEAWDLIGLEHRAAAVRAALGETDFVLPLHALPVARYDLLALTAAAVADDTGGGVVLEWPQNHDAGAIEPPRWPTSIDMELRGTLCKHSERRTHLDRPGTFRATGPVSLDLQEAVGLARGTSAHWHGVDWLPLPGEATSTTPTAASVAGGVLTAHTIGNTELVHAHGRTKVTVERCTLRARLPSDPLRTSLHLEAGTWEVRVYQESSTEFWLDPAPGPLVHWPSPSCPPGPVFEEQATPHRQLQTSRCTLSEPGELDLSPLHAIPEDSDLIHGISVVRPPQPP